MTFPDRLSNLMRKIEAGETVTSRDVASIAALQSLDIAKIGEDFAREVIALNDAAITALEGIQ